MMLQSKLFALAAKAPAHVQQAAAAPGGVFLSVTVVAVLAGLALSFMWPRPVLAALCWITVGAAGGALVGTVHDTFASVVTSVGNAVSHR
jgi:tetrahydromethanopterin S-methyltransferase subunit E